MRMYILSKCRLTAVGYIIMTQDAYCKYCTETLLEQCNLSVKNNIN